MDLSIGTGKVGRRHKWSNMLQNQQAIGIFIHAIVITTYMQNDVQQTLNQLVSGTCTVHVNTVYFITF